MKVIKGKDHSLLYKSFSMAGKTRLSAAVMVYFNLEESGDVLTEQELWSEVSGELGSGDYLDPAMPKARGEFIVKGSCFAPEGRKIEAASVAVRVGGAFKKLVVFGDRYWKQGLPSKAIPFSEMPISWDRAFGGPDFERNPKGLGHRKILSPSGEKVQPLPNIEDPGHLVLDPGARPGPAGFGIIDPTWPQRRKKEGTFDKKWQEQVMPDLPTDTAEDYFNLTLPDQQIPGFFQPGDPVVIENMHPRFPVIKSSLPPVRLRFFLTQKDSLRPEDRDKLLFKEIENKIDTVWLFPKLRRGLVIYRCVTPILDDEFADLMRIYLVSEDSRDRPRTIEHYQEEEKKLLDRSVPIDPAPVEAARAAVASAMLRLRNIPKMLSEARERALGQAPQSKNSPADMLRLKNSIISRSQAAIDRLEEQAKKTQVKNSHRFSLDLTGFQKLRSKLDRTSLELDQALAEAEKAGQRAAEVKSSVGGRIKTVFPPRKLAEAGIALDDPLLSEKDHPWHERGFPLVNQWRNHLKFTDGLRIKLMEMGLTARTIKRAWLGEISEPFDDTPDHWGLDGDRPIELPAGLVLPGFKGPILTRITVRSGDLDDSGRDVLVPGSDVEPRSYLLDHPGPVVRVTDELEAILLEQEIGDAVQIITLPNVETEPGEQAAKAIEAAETFLMVFPGGITEKDTQWRPWIEKYPRARLLALPEGRNLFEARGLGLDIRDWILSALPLSFQEEHRITPASDPDNPFKASLLSGLTKPTPDIAALVRSFRDALQGAVQPQIASLQAKKREIQALVEKNAAKAGATDMAAPPKPTGKSMADIGEGIAERLRREKERLKKRGWLTPEHERTIDREANQAVETGRRAGRQYEAATVTLDETARKAAETKKAARNRQPTDKFKAGFEAAGLDVSDRQRLTREEVVQRLADGRNLAGTNLAGLDLSGLDFSNRDLSGCRCRKTVFKEADLTGANLERLIAGQADFSGAELKNGKLRKAVCSKADFTGAGLRGAVLSQAVLKEADLSQADLTGADLHQTVLEKAVLFQTDFSGAAVVMSVFAGARAMGACFKEARLNKCLFQKAELDRADFTRAHLTGCLFQEAVGEDAGFTEVRMNKCGLMQSDFPHIDFGGADLSGSFFKECDFSSARLIHSNLGAALFESCNLSGADFTGASAKKTRLVKCNLEKARLIAVNLFQGSLRKSRLVEADLKGSNLFGVDFYKAGVGRTDFALANLKNTPLHNRTDLL